jgi:hypothetical protein
MKFNFILSVALFTGVISNGYAQFGSLKSKVKETIKKEEPKTPTANEPAKVVTESKVAQQVVPKDIVWPEGSPYRVSTTNSVRLPIHDKYVGKIVFAKQKLTQEATKESLFSSSFNVGEPIFGRVFVKEPFKNYCLYEDGRGPYDNNYCEGYAYFYFDDNKTHTASIKFNHNGGSSNWVTWQMFVNAIGEDAKLNKEGVIKAINELSTGTHKVRVEIIAGNTGRYGIEPLAFGDFTLTKAEGAKLKLGASWNDYKSKMTNATLEKQILTVVAEHASAQGWSEKFSKIKILDAEWIEIKNDYTGIPTHRVLNLVAYAKWPDGHCTAQEFSVEQQYALGTGAFSKTINFGGVGNQDKIDCE